MVTRSYLPTDVLHNGTALGRGGFPARSQQAETSLATVPEALNRSTSLWVWSASPLHHGFTAPEIYARARGPIGYGGYSVSRLPRAEAWSFSFSLTERIINRRHGYKPAIHGMLFLARVSENIKSRGKLLCCAFLFLGIY